MKDFKTFFYEKTILGLIENIDIDGIGIVSAKLDTGNGAYNVLHGEDIEGDDNMIRFTSINGFRLEKPVDGHVTINIGAGQTEDRPVCKFTGQVGGKKFPDVPFSIGNRSNNEHKVLIGKPFIQKQLDALIDVGLNNIADQNLNINTNEEI